jgi:ABC-2 type transport system permease protein
MRHSETYGDRRAATMVLRATAKRAVRSGSVWGLGFGIYVALQTSAYGTAYPTVAARERFAQSFVGNAGLAALVGPAQHLETIAGYMSWRLGILSIIGAIWGLLLATRLLRGEEDAGRWELLLSGQTTRRRAAGQAIVGLAAGLAALWIFTAALTVVEGTRSAVGFSTSACMFWATCAVAGAAMFIAVGSLTGQLCGTRRRANGVAAAVFGGSFLVRMVADSSRGLEWLRWASPLGWVEELHPLVGTRPFALLPIVALIVLAAGGAFAIAGRRDLDASVLANRDTAAAHTRLLRGPGGLTVRLSRSVVLGWIAGLAAVGLVMGLVAQGASKAVSAASGFDQKFFHVGVQRGGVESYLGIAFVISAALIAFAAAGQIASARNDEADGSLDNLLVQPVGRVRWLADRLAVSTTFIVIAGVATGVAAWIGATTQHSHVGIDALVQAGINVAAPALFVLGVGALVYGLTPRLVSPVLYGLVVWSFVIEIIGPSLKANHWILDTAILSHITPAPAVNPNWTAVMWLVALGLAAATAGMFAFNRRDLANA